MGLEDLNEKIKLANSRIRETRKFYKGEHSSLDFAQKSIDKVYGSGKRKYYDKVTDKTSLREINRIKTGIQHIFDSPYFSARGRKKLHSEQIKMLQNKITGLSKSDAERLLDTLDSQEWEIVRTRSGISMSGFEISALGEVIQKFHQEDAFQLLKDYVDGGSERYGTFFEYVEDAKQALYDVSVVNEEISIQDVSSLMKLMKEEDSIESVVKLLLK